MAWRLNLDLHAASRFITFVSANLILRHSCLLQFVRRQALVAINAVNSGPLWYPIFYIMNSENRPYRDAAEAALRKQINPFAKAEENGIQRAPCCDPECVSNKSRLRNGKLAEYGIPENFIDVLLPNRILREQAKG